MSKTARSCDYSRQKLSNKQPQENENPIIQVKSSNEETNSSTFENSDAMSPNEVMQIDSTVKYIQKEDSSNVTCTFSSNVTCTFKNTTQNIA